VKQRTFLFSALLIVISLSIYFTFFRKHSTYSQEEVISLTDTNLISKIEISDSKSKIVLSKPSNSWLVNENFNANNIEVKRLLRIFKNLEINTIVPKNESDSVLKRIRKEAIQISFFKAFTKNSFWIGNYDETRKSTLLITDDQIPVYANAPGLSSDIRKYVDTDPLFWRNKRIFNFKPEDISSIDFIDFEKSSNSFHIAFKDNEYQLFDNNNRAFNFDKNKVLRYLSYYENIEFESVVKELKPEKIDSVFKHQPRYEIKIVNKNSQAFNLKIVPIAIQSSQNQFDLNKTYGILNNQKPLVSINYFVIDPLIKQIDYFKDDSK